MKKYSLTRAILTACVASLISGAAWAEDTGMLLIQLTFSKNPQPAHKLIDYVASGEGQAVFRKFGYLDKSGKV